MAKILHINTFNNTGGAALVASTLNQMLNLGNGSYDSYLAFGRGKSQDLKQISHAYWFEKYGHALTTRLSGFEGFGSYLSTRRLIKYIDQQKFDIIHLHNLHGYYLNLELLIDYLKTSRIPVVWTFHDCWPFTGSCAYFYDCKRYKLGCGKCPYKFSYPKNLIDSSAKMWVRKKRLFSEGWYPYLVTPSQWLFAQVEQSFLKVHNLSVIPNGIDTKIFTPYDKNEAKQMLGIPDQKKVVLYVAADLNDESKGARYFFKALSELVVKDDLLVVTVGKKCNMRYDCGELVEQYGFIKDKNKLAMVYSAADVYCTTSLNEIFGLTVTEAMACGTPVVGFNVGGIPEQVSADCGILVAPRDYKALANAIDKLLVNNDLSSKMSSSCRAKVEKKYSTELFVKKYLSLYELILNKGIN